MPLIPVGGPLLEQDVISQQYLKPVIHVTLRYLLFRLTVSLCTSAFRNTFCLSARIDVNIDGMFLECFL